MARFSLGARFSYLNLVHIRPVGEQLHREGRGYDRPNAVRRDLGELPRERPLAKPYVTQVDNSELATENSLLQQQLRRTHFFLALDRCKLDDSLRAGGCINR